MTANESFNDFSCNLWSTRLVSKDRESSPVRFCGQLCFFLQVIVKSESESESHCEKRNWGKDKFSASLVENVSILFACSMTRTLVQATIFACSASNKNASVLLVYPKKSPYFCFPWQPHTRLSPLLQVKQGCKFSCVYTIEAWNFER